MKTNKREGKLFSLLLFALLKPDSENFKESVEGYTGKAKLISCRSLDISTDLLVGTLYSA